MVEEARRLMDDADDDVAPAGNAANAPEEDSGPKIKMGRIGKKSKKDAGAAKAAGSSEGYSKKLV